MEKFCSLGLAATLLLSACSKKDDPAAIVATPVASSASYTLDTRATVGTATATFHAASANTAGQDALTIVINPTTPGATAEDVVLYYRKAAGASNATYQLVNIIVDGPNAAGTYANQLAGTLTQSGAGKWAGTFSATNAGISTATRHTLKDGIFKDVN